VTGGDPADSMQAGLALPRFNRVGVVGSLNYDLTARAPRLPAPGETVLGHSFRRGPGGKGVNQAVAARRAGSPVTFTGRVGDDDFGRAFREVLRAEGIDDRHLSIDPDEPTGVGLIALGELGENQILVAPGANLTLTPAHLADAGVPHSDVLVLQCEVPAEVNHAAARQARTANTRVILNAAPACGWAHDLLPLTDVLVVNEIEAAALTGRSDPARAAETLGAQVPMVVVTLGEHGLIACLRGGCIHQPALPARAVDTVGAGDAFTGILASVWGRLPEEQALRLAQAGAALCVEQPGAIAAMPRWEAIIARHRSLPALQPRPVG